MFYYIEGILTHKEPNVAVIDCSGVGYMCNTSAYTVNDLKLNGNTRLYTYLHVKEDIFDLYGFGSLEELNCFKMLISVSGVGPKAALSILSLCAPSRVALCIISGDEKFLTTASGIGKKIAQRIVLELKDKMSRQSQEYPSLCSGPHVYSQTDTQSDAISEALSALMVLGYSQSESYSVISSLNTEETFKTSEQIIKECLKRLVK